MRGWPQLGDASGTPAFQVPLRVLREAGFRPVEFFPVELSLYVTAAWRDDAGVMGTPGLWANVPILSAGIATADLSSVKSLASEAFALLHPARDYGQKKKGAKR